MFAGIMLPGKKRSGSGSQDRTRGAGGSGSGSARVVELCAQSTKVAANFSRSEDVNGA